MPRAFAVLFALAAAAASARAEAPRTASTSGGAPAATAPVTAEPPATVPSAAGTSAGAAPSTAAPAASSGEAAAAPTVRTKKRRKKPAAPPPPAAELVAINTHETYELRPDSHGRFTRAQLRGWNRFLRCHHTGRVHQMSSRLASLIYEVAKHFDFRKIEVVAGYRAPRVAREKGNPKSPHKKGVACDFRIDGVPNTELRDYERTLPHVGVGYYPNSEFVHLDCDPLRNKRSAFWIDYSRPGERAKYSRNPEADLEEEEQQHTATSSPTSSPTDFLAPALEAPVGGGEPQTPLLPGAPAPNGPPPIFPLLENH